MLEVLFLSWFARSLAAKAKAKGRSGWWGGLGVLLWIGGEITGFVIGVATELGQGASYLLAIVMAALGAVIAYVTVSSLGGSDAVPVSAGGGWSHHDPSNPYSPPGGDPTRRGP